MTQYFGNFSTAPLPLILIRSHNKLLQSSGPPPNLTKQPVPPFNYCTMPLFVPREAFINNLITEQEPAANLVVTLLTRVLSLPLFQLALPLPLQPPPPPVLPLSMDGIFITLDS